MSSRDNNRHNWVPANDQFDTSVNDSGVIPVFSELPDSGIMSVRSPNCRPDRSADIQALNQKTRTELLNLQLDEQLAQARRADMRTRNLSRMVREQISSLELEWFFYDLKETCKKNMDRHPKLIWDKFFRRLLDNQKMIETLYYSKKFGGQPELLKYMPDWDRYFIVEFFENAPKDRVNLVYDETAEKKARKEGRFCNGNAINLAREMRMSIVTDTVYEEMQRIKKIDIMPHWSWIRTHESGPKSLRGFRTDNGEIRIQKHYSDLFDANGTCRLMVDF